jgi:putative tryptophan/tyrosine transport system substrate-binding protein
VKRREFIGLIGGAASFWPVTVSAQQTTRIPRVVYLSPVNIPQQVSSYRAQMRELGYVEGRNIRLEFRDAGGEVDRLPVIAEGAVGAGDVDAIVAISTPAALAAHKATETIPIVAFTAVDPVGSGLAISLASPGRNVTGIAVFSEETTVKRVELMREIAPRAIRLATVTTKVSKGAQSVGPLLDAGRKLGFTVENLVVDDPADLAEVLSSKALAVFDAFVFIPDVVLSSHMAEIIKLVGASNKPAIFPSPDWVANGGLISFGPDYADASRHLTAQLDRILKGAKPGDLPFERPTKFDLRINLRTAQAMGIELSPIVLARADEVIE